MWRYSIDIFSERKRLDQLENKFRDSLLRALDEDRIDDLVLMLANRLRSQQQVISPHSRAALPVDKSLCRPIVEPFLTPEDIETFDIRDTGWHLIAVREAKIIGAERFAHTIDQPDYQERLAEYMDTLSVYYGRGADIYAAKHAHGMFVDFQYLHEFRPECSAT